MTRGTTDKTVNLTVSVPRELFFEAGENLDSRALEAEYGADKCGANNGEEEEILRRAILPYLAELAGLSDGELVIRETGAVDVDRKRADDGTFTPN